MQENEGGLGELSHSDLSGLETGLEQEEDEDIFKQLSDTSFELEQFFDFSNDVKVTNVFSRIFAYLLHLFCSCGKLKILVWSNTYEGLDSNHLFNTIFKKSLSLIKIMFRIRAIV